MRKTNGNGELGQAWRDYKETGSVEARNSLAEFYLPYVIRSAGFVVRGLREGVLVGKGDLVQEGIIKLLEYCIERYDPARGVKFETYIAPIIRGVFMDALRGIDVLSRLTREHLDKYEKASCVLRGENNGEPPSEEQIMQRTGLNKNQLRNLARNRVEVFRIGNPREGKYRRKEIDDLGRLEDKGGINPCEAVEREDVKNHIMECLSRTERVILSLYYYEGLNMKEIGDSISLSESRVSQMHSVIMRKLRKRFSESEKGKEELEALVC